MNGYLSLRRPTSPLLAAWCALAGLAPLGCAYSTDLHDGVEATDDVASEVTASTIRVEAEDYLTGGEGVGYHDTTPGNEGAVYRQDNVDVQASTDVGGGYGVGWTAAGEWLAYAFNAPASATYQLSVRLSSHVVGAKRVHVEIDGASLPAASYTDATGWQTWQTLSLGSRALTAGAHTIKLVADDGGVNFNYLEASYTPPAATIGCPTGFGTEVFRDDFNGAAVDTAKWSIIQQNNGGSAFTQLTKMLPSNVTVSNGRLKIASRRYCADPYPNQAVAEHPEKCAGASYYSGGWLKTVGNYAPAKGMMIFHAKMPAPVPGIFPALWARNTYGDLYYGELDLIETWWDMTGKGSSTNNTSLFASTTHVITDAWHNTSSNTSPITPNLVSVFHVWEVEWDASATPPTVRYYYRDAPGATRVLLRTVTHQSPGLSGYVTADQFKTILSAGWRAYVDFAVQPDSAWHVGPDTAQTYDPEDLEVDSVIICKP